MLELLKDLPPGINGLRAVGKISKEDYERSFNPLIDEARRTGRRLRLLCEVGTDFKGLTPGGAWEDAKIGLRSIRLFDGFAVVSDFDWIRKSVQLFGFMMSCPVKVFGSAERTQAVGSEGDGLGEVSLDVVRRQPVDRLH